MTFRCWAQVGLHVRLRVIRSVCTSVFVFVFLRGFAEVESPSCAPPPPPWKPQQSRYDKVIWPPHDSRLNLCADTSGGLAEAADPCVSTEGYRCVFPQDSLVMSQQLSAPPPLSPRKLSHFPKQKLMISPESSRGDERDNMLGRCSNEPVYLDHKTTRLCQSATDKMPLILGGNINKRRAGVGGCKSRNTREPSVSYFFCLLPEGV